MNRPETNKPSQPVEPISTNPNYHRIFGKQDLFDAVKTITDDYAFNQELAESARRHQEEQEDHFDELLEELDLKPFYKQ